jgi:hypothetical protein
LQASRQFFGRVAVIGALAVTGIVSAPSAAHAAGATTSMELPVIELKAKSTAQPATTTTAPKSNVTIMTIPTANVGNNAAPTGGETSQQATTTTQAPAAGGSGSAGGAVVGDSNGSTGSNESSSGGSLASTGVNARQITGIAMLLTAIGIALLTFTNSVNRTERFVRSLLPHRISGK